MKCPRSIPKPVPINKHPTKILPFFINPKVSPLFFLNLSTLILNNTNLKLIFFIFVALIITLFKFPVKFIKSRKTAFISHLMNLAYEFSKF